MQPVPISIENARDLQILADFSAFNVESVAVSSDNQHLAYSASSRGDVTKNPDDIISWGGSCVIMNYFTKEVSKLPATHYRSGILRHLEYNSTGKYLAYIDTDGFYVWDVEAYSLVLKHVNRFSPEDFCHKFIKSGKKTEHLIVVYVDKIQIFDISSWKIVNEFAYEYIDGYQIIAPETYLIATLDKNEYGKGNNTVTVRDMRTTGASKWTHSVDTTFEGFSQAICFHPSGNLLAVGGAGCVTIWKVPQGELVTTLRFERGFVTETLSFSPDGRLLGIGLVKGIIVGHGEDSDVDIVKSFTLWDWEWGAQLFQLPNMGGSSRFSPDGSRLVIYNREGIQVWIVGEKDTPKRKDVYFEGDLPDYDNQGHPYDHPDYGEDW